MLALWKLARVGLAACLVVVCLGLLNACSSKEVKIDQPSQEEMTPEERAVQENIQKMMEAPMSPPPAVGEALEQRPAE